MNGNLLLQDHFFLVNVVQMTSIQAVKSGILQFQIYEAAICIKKCKHLYNFLIYYNSQKKIS